eukprot:snap_masked-scaffold_6-processed-gene-15.42-mRNA-1 protein AED:1.00 eAED:1.00 QI:0/0/0/0/1/1/2/0/116
MNVLLRKSLIFALAKLMVLYMYEWIDRIKCLTTLVEKLDTAKEILFFECPNNNVFRIRSLSRIRLILITADLFQICKYMEVVLYISVILFHIYAFGGNNPLKLATFPTPVHRTLVA